MNITGLSILENAVNITTTTIATNDTLSDAAVIATGEDSTWSTTVSTTTTTTSATTATPAGNVANNNISGSTGATVNVTIEIDPERVKENVVDGIEYIVNELADPLNNYYHYYAYRIGQILDPDKLLMEEVSNDTTTYINLTDLAVFVEECGEGLSPIIDKMFLSLSRTAHHAVGENRDELSAMRHQ